MQAAKPFAILITDDDPGCRQSLREIVEAEGFSTYVAASGEEALDVVREEPVHLALFDMHMPMLSGLETLELARQINALLQCILMTADPSEDLIRQAFRARVYSVIPKPVSKNIVLYTVVRALRCCDPKQKKRNEDAPGEHPEPDPLPS